jgi:hypothetical protein
MPQFSVRVNSTPGVVAAEHGVSANVSAAYRLTRVFLPPVP